MGFIPAPAGNADVAEGAHDLPAVHPRACGERVSAALIVSSSCGSSPRLRGTRYNDFGHTENNRFIPAPAGNA